MTRPDAANSGLNENHVRHVVTTFRYMDELLSKAEHIMASAGSPSPFQEYADDTTPLQRKVTHDYVARLRGMMSRSLEELGIPRPAPVTGALWAARNAVTFTNIALAEMESKRMGGYGKMSDAAARKLDAIVAELRAAIDKLEDYLAQSGGADLQGRLQRLEKTSHEAPLLRELERIITAHGLVEFRNAVTTLLERMENGTFEIGVFGRVSSGKSSLLNHLLGGDYLPVGVTPVTAVPTRISYGERPQVRVEFADNRPQVVELSALADFATEQQNPGNAKHVSRIRVEIPAAMLREGVTFVDTPGLGSLATGGAEETVAYLPRCDLGIVLVDAASTLTREDLQVIHAVYAAGAAAMVLLSKADLLRPADRERVVEYVRKQILAEAGVELSVHPVSVVGAAARLCEEWVERHLRPQLAAHRQLAAASLKRKVGGLREALLAALKRRVEGALASGPEASPDRLRAIEEALRNAPQSLETARRTALELARKIQELGDTLVDAAAEAMAAPGPRPVAPALEPAAVFSTTATRLLADASAGVRRVIEQTGAQLADAFQGAAQVLPGLRPALQELPKAAGLPLPDFSNLAAKLALRPPAVLGWLGRGILRRYLRRKLAEQIGRELDDVLGFYSRRLSEWTKEAFARLDAAFSANAGVVHAQLERRGPVASSPSAGGDQELRRDIALLETWEQRAAAPESVPTA